MKKIVLVSSLNHMNLFLQNKPFYTPPCIYADRIAIQEKTLNIGCIKDTINEQKEYKSIRIWKTKSLFNWWFNKQSSDEFIGVLDYVMNDDHIKCEHMSIKDVTEVSYYNSKSILTSEEISELSKSFITHLKLIAQKENKPKIIVDVHQNLRIYGKFYEYEGFVMTERKSSDNPFYLEAEMVL